MSKPIVITAKVALTDLIAAGGRVVIEVEAPAGSTPESSLEPDYEAGFDWKAAWYALDHDAAQLRSQVEALKRKIKVAHVLCLGTAPKQAVGEVLAAALPAPAEARSDKPEGGR